MAWEGINPSWQKTCHGGWSEDRGVLKSQRIMRQRALGKAELGCSPQGLFLRNSPRSDPQHPKTAALVENQMFKHMAVESLHIETWCFPIYALFQNLCLSFHMAGGRVDSKTWVISTHHFRLWLSNQAIFPWSIKALFWSLFSLFFFFNVIKNILARATLKKNGLFSYNSRF